VGRSLGNGLREFKDSLQNPDHPDDAPLEVEDPPKPVATAAATAPVSPEDEKS
jgi:hypothetical protein